VEEVLETLLPRWTRARDGLAGIAAHYQGLFGSASALSTLVGLGEGTRSLAATEIPMRQIEQSLRAVRADAAVPGEMYLRRNVDEGDQVRLTMRVTDPRTGNVLASQERTLGVRTYGLHRTWSAGLAFASRADADGFDPGLSTSYILHYRRRPEQGGAAALGSILDPNALGVGVTSVVFTRDGGIQVGVGPTVTVLGDLVQGGYGLNLQTEKWYVMIATPLLDLLSRARDAVSER
jgi:hypothetical protein